MMTALVTVPSETPDHWISFNDSLETSLVTWGVFDEKWNIILPSVDDVQVEFSSSITQPTVEIIEPSPISIVLLIGGLIGGIALLKGGDKNEGNT